MSLIPALASRVVNAFKGDRRHDGRARRIIAVIECVMNQNARDEGAAVFPALNADVIQLCRDHDVGVVQIPCPEMRCLGLSRTRPAGTSIRDALDTDAGRGCCRALAVEIADRLQAYASGGCTVLAVVGGNPQSPGCAVHHGPDGLRATSGVLMRELHAELRARGLDVPFLSMRDADAAALAEDVGRLQELLQAA